MDLVNTMQTILVIDDDKAIRYMIRSILEVVGYNVLEACNGKEGLSIFKRCLIDLIISDIIMPDMDGVEMIRSIRNDIKSEVKIIAMSGQGDLGDLGLDVALKLGVQRILAKPFQPADLFNCISFELEKEKK